MNKLYKVSIGLASALAAVLCVTPALAADEIQPRTTDVPVVTSDTPTTINATHIEPTFVENVFDDGKGASLIFGDHSVLAGNNLTVNNRVSGMLFAFGNRVNLSTSSEYGIVAGNVVDFEAQTDKDLFIAGNMVTIRKGALIGRDVFGTGNEFTVESNLAGDLSIAAARIELNNVTIAGNANLSAGEIVFSGEVTIRGELSYNDDAKVVGLDKATAGKVSTYTIAKAEVEASDFWFSKVISVVGLFVSMVIVILVFPKVKERLAATATPARFGKGLLVGLGFAVAVPVIAIVLMMTVVSAPAGLMLLGTDVLVMYLASAFAGTWLGYVIVEKLFHNRLPLIVEALIGILILGLVEMIPFVCGLVSVVACLLGIGLIVACVRPGKKSAAIAAETAKPLDNPFRGQKKSHTKAKKTTKK